MALHMAKGTPAGSAADLTTEKENLHLHFGPTAARHFLISHIDGGFDRSFADHST